MFWMVWKSDGKFSFAYSTFFIFFLNFSFPQFTFSHQQNGEILENVNDDEWMNFIVHICARTAQVIAFVTFNYMSSFSSDGRFSDCVSLLEWLCEFIHKLDYNVYIELTYGDSCKWHISDSFSYFSFFPTVRCSLWTHLTHVARSSNSRGSYTDYEHRTRIRLLLWTI